MRFSLSIFFLLLISINASTQTKPIEIEYKRNTDKSVDFFFKKNEPGSYYLMLKFKNLTNAYPSDYLGVVKGYGGKIISLKPSNPKDGISFSYTYSYFRGIPNPKIDSSFIYLLPFSKDKKVLINEMNFLGTTHFGNELPKNWKAYQFLAFDTDTAFASRKGLVVDLIDYYETDTTSYFTSKKNEVIIEHADGSFASYQGFNKNEIFVQKGQTILPQAPLGVLRKIIIPLDAKEKSYGAYLAKLNFKLYFLIDTDLKVNETLNNHKSRFEYISPYFYTSDGIMKLQNKTNYTVDFNEKTLLFEFSRKELKNRKKQNSK